ncbi:MAG: TetR/AcrR family transcriptional regulator [Acidimicrobiia bacterium]
MTEAPLQDQLGTGGRRKVGRPARLDREMIARAASEVGLDRVTMKAVADRLGVSVPGLYHHVEGRDDLMALAAEYSASRIAIPVDRGQQWTEWLVEWSRYSYDAFVKEPELLNQYLRGSISLERMVVHLDAVIGFLDRHGFTPVEARDAYSLVSQCAIGAAFNALRHADLKRNRESVLLEYQRAFASRAPGELPYLRKLVGTIADPPSFDDEIVTVLVGIAVRRGDPWQPILELAHTGTDATVIALHP